MGGCPRNSGFGVSRKSKMLSAGIASPIRSISLDSLSNRSLASPLGTATCRSQREIVTHEVPKILASFSCERCARLRRSTISMSRVIAWDENAESPEGLLRLSARARTFPTLVVRDVCSRVAIFERVPDLAKTFTLPASAESRNSCPADSPEPWTVPTVSPEPNGSWFVRSTEIMRIERIHENGHPSVV
jgi:hypothetical protein